MKVLVVDNEPAEVETLRRGLACLGYSVVSAESSDEALQVIDREGDSLGLVMTDYVMPGRDGLFLIEEIRNRYPAMPVVLVTGQLGSEVYCGNQQKLCCGVLEKPFDLEKLRTELERVISTSAICKTQ